MADGLTDFDPTGFDRRRHPARADLAASRYRHTGVATRYVDGLRRRVTADCVDLRPAPDLARSIDTQALYGEEITVYEIRDGWAWGQIDTDGYVGYLDAAALGDVSEVPTHRVAVLGSFRYPQADLKHPPLGHVSLGGKVTVAGWTTTRGLEYAVLADGSAMVAGHLLPVGTPVRDWVEVAERFLHVPYRWGGRSSAGLDCSALVQLAAAEAGYRLPRDTDMQAKEAGIPVDVARGLGEARRGDLVFWRGHVGIVRDRDTLLHANGHTMTVASEPLQDAVARIAAHEWGTVTGIRRL